MQQALVVATFLGFRREINAIGDVIIGKATAHSLSRQLVTDITEQASSNDLERLLGAHWLPQCLHAAKVVRQRFQRAHATLTTGFFFRLR